MSTIRLAVAQIEVGEAVPANGERVRATIADAAARGARVVQFPEATLAPRGGHVAAARDELAEIGRACRTSGIWAVVGAPAAGPEGGRPHNSLHVFSPAGEQVARYDKRFLSASESSVYTRGTDAVVFDVDGFRFGLAICLETLFPEVFVDYAAMDVDAVLVSSAPDPTFGRLAFAHAVMNAIGVAIAFAAGGIGDPQRSGACTSDGWLALADDARPSLVVADVPKLPAEPSFQRRSRQSR